MNKDLQLKWDIFFDPNTDPSYFYPMIKPFLLIADNLHPFSPHENMMQESGKQSIDPSEFFKFVKKDWIQPIISTEWDSPKNRKKVINYAPLREFTTLDHMLYSDEKYYIKLKDSSKIRETSRNIAKQILIQVPEIAEDIAAIFLDDLKAVKKQYPNLSPEKLPSNLPTKLPPKFYQTPYKKGNEYKAAEKILYEYFTNALVLNETGKPAPFTKPSWFELYQRIIFDKAIALNIAQEGFFDKIISQQIVSEVIHEFVKGESLPKLDDLSIKDIEYYRDRNAHKSMQRWVESRVQSIFSDNRNEMKDSLVKNTRNLLKKADLELRLFHASMLECLGAAIPITISAISGILWVMLLSPFLKALTQESIGETLKKRSTQTIHSFDPQRFAFIINSYNPGYFKGQLDE